ncbi:hypothetical protein ZIOFF_025844 [Zingiber officinale]|uniref:Uncharacterized protein n=1 Tax=Zingiber officinale TaxID=94328 RepID=A0A8J5LHH9_ZINOF|nr:hypothetical protein ZIOFF_025844 [Zingiber officinale]
MTPSDAAKQPPSPSSVFDLNQSAAAAAELLVLEADSAFDPNLFLTGHINSELLEDNDFLRLSTLSQWYKSESILMVDNIDNKLRIHVFFSNRQNKLKGSRNPVVWLEASSDSILTAISMAVAPTDSAQGASDSGHGNLNPPTQGGAKPKPPSSDLNPPTQGGAKPKLPSDSGQANLNLPSQGGAKPKPKPLSVSGQADLNPPAQGVAKPNPPKPAFDFDIVTLYNEKSITSNDYGQLDARPVPSSVVSYFQFFPLEFAAAIGNRELSLGAEI